MNEVSAKIEVVGLKEALKTLNKIDKSLRREITKDYKKIVQPVIDDANALVPTGVPLSGMARNWSTKSGFKMLPWVPGMKQKIAAKNTTCRQSLADMFELPGVRNGLMFGSTTIGSGWCSGQGEGSSD